jgi:peptidoglycan/LPS O-acetylase OafA/YrhL
MAKTRSGKKKERAPETSSPLQDNRIYQVDLLKGFAIIAVILIHTFTSNLLTVIGAPYYLWQAVPVFLLLAAFTGALSYSRLNKRSLLHCYDFAVLYKRFRRVLVPFVIIWVIQVIVILYLWPPNLPLYTPNSVLVYSGIFGIITFFFTGGSGPGNYFIPLILTQILILPFFYWLAVRFSPDKMLVFAFITDMVLQYVLYLVNMPAVASAFFYLNYLFLAALGIWLALRPRKQMALVIIAGLLSFVYITAVYYFKFQIWFIDPSSGFFNEFSYFWTLVLVLCGLRYLPSSPLTRPFESIAELGKASWHIFLVQMTVIGFLNYSMMMVIRGVVPGFGMPEMLTRQMINTLLTMVICLTIGYGFYLAEKYLKKRVHPILKNQQ